MFCTPLSFRLMPVFLSENVRLAHRRKDLAPSEGKEIRRCDHGAPEVLSHELARRLAEDNINLLKCFVLGLRHEKNLVKPSEYGDTTVESQSKTGLCHRFLHLSEKVCDEERT